MPIYAIEATGRVADHWKSKGIVHLLYGNRPRAYRDLEQAVARAQELKRFCKDEPEIDFRVRQVPLEFNHLYWPLG